MRNSKFNNGPLVSVMMCTYNRPRYVPVALESIFHQTYENFEIILVRDGGTEVRPVISNFLDDSRLVFIDRDRNLGKAASLNEGIEKCRGKYVCYLDDDDIYYPEHIELLSGALENNDMFGGVYSDLYKVHCRIEQDGTRTALSKNVEVCRDFNRWTMMRFNHVLHVSFMHRRELFEQTGGYNEKINVLIDWDMTRKMSFYTDMFHLPYITGEFYAPLEECDRISIQQRKDINRYVWNLLTIRNTRPAKPWPKMNDISLIVIADNVDDNLYEMLRGIWSNTYYPHETYLPMEESKLSAVNTKAPNLTGIVVEPGLSETERIARTLEHCKGDYIGIIDVNFPINQNECSWIERALCPMFKNSDPLLAYELPESDEFSRAYILSAAQAKRAVRYSNFKCFYDNVISSGIIMKKPAPETWPLQFDNFYTQMSDFEEQNDWAGVARTLKYMRENFPGDKFLINTKYVGALCNCGYFEKAAEIAHSLNEERPSVSTLLVEARALGKMDRANESILLLEQAADILEGRKCHGYIERN